MGKLEEYDRIMNEQIEEGIFEPVLKKMLWGRRFIMYPVRQKGRNHQDENSL